MLEHMPTKDAIAELRPFYPKLRYWFNAHGSRIYLNDGTNDDIWARPTFLDVACNQVWAAIAKAVTAR